MIYHEYVSKTFPDWKLDLIQACNETIIEYDEMGYDMTLRQLYYQLVSKDLILNTQLNYNRLGKMVGDARLAGLLPWDKIVDRMRNLVDYNTYEEPHDIAGYCPGWYRRDLWEGQGMTLEVWIEKDALSGVFGDICNKLRIPLFSCRGYTSLSEMWGAGRRLKRRADVQGRGTYILHFGDHDPSGIDMSRDIEDRLSMFCDHRDIFAVERVALNMDQVHEYNPPANFAKETDSRLRGYRQRFGFDECWELDALDPPTLEALVQDRRDILVDQDEWAIQEKRERFDCEELKNATSWLKGRSENHVKGRTAIK